MKKLILIFMAMLASIVSRAEDFPLVRETMSLSLQVRQKPGTEGLLKEYLGMVPADQDTIYAILYEPGFCPRCEVFINGVGGLLKQQSPTSRLVLITTYSDSARAAAYNKAKERASRAGKNYARAEETAREQVERLSQRLQELGGTIGGQAGESISLIGQVGS